MSRTQATADLMTRLQLAVNEHEEYPLDVELDNDETIDPAGREHPYLKVDIKFLGGAEQKDLGQTNVTIEQWGQIHLAAVVACGSGTHAAERLLAFLEPYFDLEKVGIVQCKAVSALDPKKVNELHHARAIVPFYYHRRT